MKFITFETIKEVSSALSVGILSWWIWWWLMHLYNFTKWEKFKLSVFLISTGIWWFVGFIIGEITTSSSLAGIWGAISMKIFDIASENWAEILRKYIKKKYNIK